MESPTCFEIARLSLFESMRKTHLERWPCWWNARHEWGYQIRRGLRLPSSPKAWGRRSVSDWPEPLKQMVASPPETLWGIQSASRLAFSPALLVGLLDREPELVERKPIQLRELVFRPRVDPLKTATHKLRGTLGTNRSRGLLHQSALRSGGRRRPLDQLHLQEESATLLRAHPLRKSLFRIRQCDEQTLRQRRRPHCRNCARS
ncbi:unannotated protein [freshwater metagenome]|uniref:Unannotated protein n=1 Tax=freshwater metagenome TaxID=449393 RepID=A0A6J7RSF7_9ZZZZ